MKCAIYGIGKWTETIIFVMSHFINCDVVYYVQTKPETCCFHGIEVRSPEEIKCDDFDYLVISPDDYGDIIENLKQLPDGEKILKKTKHNMEWCRFVAEASEERIPYQSVTTQEGLKYIARTKDIVIPTFMYHTSHTWSKDEIDLYFELSRKRGLYPKSERGVFFDIGANIGTTSVYVKSKYPNLQIVGIEPGKENSCAFQINTIINNMDDVTIDEIGLSDCSGEIWFHYLETNSGGSGLLDQSGDNSYKVKIQTFDEYVSINNIDIEDISYIWIDTEGYEANVIHGASNTLRNIAIPVWQEFNPEIYKSLGVWERYLKDVEELFDFFIDKNEPNTEHPSDHLDDYYYLMKRRGIKQTDIMLF